MLVALLSWMFRRKGINPFPIFLDSPMAIEATKIYTKHFELFDEELLNFIKEKPMREDLKTLTLCVSSEQSKKINTCSGTCLVMAGAGMCTAGRILHHFKQNLWKPETFVLIVGYQDKGCWDDNWWTVKNRCFNNPKKLFRILLKYEFGWL